MSKDSNKHQREQRKKPTMSLKEKRQKKHDKKNRTVEFGPSSIEE